MARAQTNDGRGSRARDDRSFRVWLIGLLMTVMWVLPAAADETPIFTEDQKILASDGVAGDRLGRIGTSGIWENLLIIGASGVDGPGGVESGAAYIYRFNGSEWIEEVKLIHPDSAYEGYFGRSVAIYDNIAVVCADKDTDSSNPYGAAYIYRFDGEDWELETKFTGDGSQTTTFGRSVAIYDNVIAVGDTGVVFNPGEGEDGYGAAFMYRYNGTNWNLEAKLRGDNVTPAQGYGLALDEKQIIIGSNTEYWSPTSRAFIFRYTGTEWVKDATLEIVEWDNWYGRSVDIRGNLAIVGSADDGSDDYRGSAYIYKGSGAPNYEWTLDEIIMPSDLQDYDYFGEAVAIADEETVIVQSMGHELDGYGWSTLYVFREIDDEWTETARLTTSDTGDYFGALAQATLSAEGSRVVVGSPYNDNQNGIRAGAAFYYDIGHLIPPCPGDVDGDRDVDLSDLGALLASFGLEPGDPWYDVRADVDGDGDVDLSDLGALLAAYELPCP
jgi:hypothetical protein